MGRIQLENFVIVGLIAVTMVLVLLQHYSLNHQFVVDTDFNNTIIAVSDDTTGGQSKASLQIVDNKFLLDCDIDAITYPYPFCEITISLFDEDNPTGIDLSSFESVTIFAKYLSPNQAPLRFQIRSFNKAYADINDQSTWKYIGVEYNPLLNTSPVTIPLTSMQVASWWLVEQRIPIALSSPEFEHVMSLEVSTGNGIASGYYQLELERIVFTGKYLKSSQLYGFIIILWLLSAVVLVVVNAGRARRKLHALLKQSEELRQLNRLLNVETKSLKNKAERDPLTGALNRTGIKPVFTQEIPLLSLIFIDIDHFKQVNDGHGHNVGDEVLKRFAALIQDNCRSSDFLARWGGEEFLLVCPNTELEAACELAEDLRQLITETKWENGIKLTSSFGVAQRRNEGNSQLIKRADMALYRAKIGGRNRVEIEE